MTEMRDFSNPTWIPLLVTEYQKMWIEIDATKINDDHRPGLVLFLEHLMRTTKEVVVERIAGGEDPGEAMDKCVIGMGDALYRLGLQHGKEGFEPTICSCNIIHNN